MPAPSRFPTPPLVPPDGGQDDSAGAMSAWLEEIAAPATLILAFVIATAYVVTRAAF